MPELIVDSSIAQAVTIMTAAVDWLFVMAATHNMGGRGKGGRVQMQERQAKLARRFDGDDTFNVTELMLKSQR